MTLHATSCLLGSKYQPFALWIIDLVQVKYIMRCQNFAMVLHIYCDVTGSPCLSKKGESNMRFVPFKDPWPRVLSLPERFVGDPVSQARDNIYTLFLNKESVTFSVGTKLNMLISVM